MFLNAMFAHGYMPDKLMQSVIIPIVKNKKGDITNMDNYRPIAITTVLSKILELIILSKFRHLLLTKDNQFGFKQKHGTDMCIFALQQIVDYYQSLNSPVYICYLDASKAFDRLNYWCLCNELGGNMARFTQFPIMITRSTIIYEIISPGAAGSSIYV